MAILFSQVIAIDGPSGSGKSTMAKKLSSQLGLLFIDTGAMFRAIAFFADQQGVLFEEGPQLEVFLSRMDMKYSDNKDELIIINGQNLTSKIRDHHVSTLASQISQLPCVRTFLLKFQRELGRKNVCVMEGRDIGTVVFPNAFCKIFITATTEVRAKRRYDQLKANNSNNNESYTQVLEDVVERDRKDTQREVAPLKVAEQASVVDTSEMDEAMVLDHLVALVRSKALEANIKL